MNDTSAFSFRITRGDFRHPCRYNFQLLEELVSLPFSSFPSENISTFIITYRPF